MASARNFEGIGITVRIAGVGVLLLHFGCRRVLQQRHEKKQHGRDTLQYYTSEGGLLGSSDHPENEVGAQAVNVWGLPGPQMAL